LTDLRAALRGLARDRAFTFFCVLALALGLGLNGSLLVLSRAFLLRPGPVRDPGTLVEVLDDSREGAKGDREGSTTAYAAVRELPEFVAVALAPCRSFELRWRVGDGLRKVQAMEASSEYLEVVGMRPFLGRNFRPEESGLLSDGQVAMVSHRFWREALKGRPDVLGQALVLDGKARTVVGVLPPGFEGHRLDLGMEVLVSSKVEVLPALEGGRYMTGVLARLRPGASLGQVRARLRNLPWSSHYTLDAQPYQPLPTLLGARLTRGLALLHGAGLLILGIALCNVLALQSARMQRRKSEWALRLALGAGGRQLLRLLLLENLVLASLAGLAGWALSAVSTPFLDALQAVLPYPPKVRVAFGLLSAAATFLSALGLGLLLALAGTLQARRRDLGRPLEEGGTRTGRLGVRGSLVAVQAALSLVLLCTCALSLRDLRRQLDIPLGYALEDRFQLSCDPRGANRPWRDLEPLMPLLRARLGALPGVKTTALSMGGAPMVQGVRIRENGGRWVHCTPELPELLAMRPVKGRGLEVTDTDQGRVLVDESMARILWPGQPALGLHAGLDGQPLEVVGVVETPRMEGPTRPLTPVLFMPVTRVGTASRFPFETLTLHLPGSPRGTVDAIRATAREVLGALPFEFSSLEGLRDEQLAQPRRLLLLSGVLGALALGLSLCGLYGLAAHLAEARQRELGIRVVLGAGPGRILAALAKGSLLPVVPGLLAGAGLSLAVSRLLVSQTPGFAGLDAHLLVASCLTLAIAAALACLFPALRAVRVNPAEALRSE